MTNKPEPINGWCGICADCAPQINGGSGFKNCAEAHDAQLAEDIGMNKRLTDERIAELIKMADTYCITYAEESEDTAVALRELQERRKADSAEPVAWRYRYVHSPKTEEHGSPFTTEWKLCDSEGECNPSDCFERQPLYTASQPAPEREQVRRDYTEDVKSKQSVKIGIYERIYGLLRECPGTDSIYSVAPIEGECIPHGVLAHIGCISFYCNLGHLHIAEPTAFTGCHTHSLSGGTND
ncbi:hypothetical protein [Citrobacter freundii]|uniref:hypothetical protein n=1 Tax=Citrobacter freundii TaxID=546 RepID=UPI0023B06991|nr:hypothetical protein [Citrobacter freundii]